MPEPVKVGVGDRVSVRFYRHDYPGRIVRVRPKYAVARFTTVVKRETLDRKVVVYRAEDAKPCLGKPGLLVAVYVGPAEPAEVPDAIP